MQHTFFVQAFAVLHDTLLFCTTKTYNFLVTHYFYGGIAVFAHQKFCCLCSYSIFFHSRSFSPRWLQAFLMFITAAIKFLCFSSNEICLLCFKSLALAIHWYAYDVEGQSHGYTAMWLPKFPKWMDNQFFLGKGALLPSTKWRTWGLSKWHPPLKGQF